MQQKKVLVSGCNGTMGQWVCKAINTSPDMQVIAGFDKFIPSSPYNFPVYLDPGSIIGEYPDIVVDFSNPKGTAKISRFCYNHKIPIVIATTGLDSRTKSSLREYADRIPIFQSANMSFDVALLRKILKIVAPQLANTDIEISETHHNRKKDSPSGTAIMLADTINEALENTKTSKYGREGKREKTEIGLSAIRGGNIVGEHTIYFFGEHETLEIKHTAHSREMFAEGAVKAARFLLTQNPGFYGMDDLISM